jgi:hypothetical protein
MPPPGWRPNPNRTKSLLERKAPPKLSENLAKAADRLTPFQRAKLLGEQDHSVMEMLSTAEREKLKQIRQRKDGERRRDEGRIRGRQNEAEYFEEEPMKAHRFKQYVAYLKRGLHSIHEKYRYHIKDHKIFSNNCTPKFDNIMLH